MACGGNPQFLSHVCHLGNLIPHSRDRPDYKMDGSPNADSTTQVINRVAIGSARMHFPIREDFRQLIKEVYDELQVDKKSARPYKWVRYPQEEGEIKANLLNSRIKWLTDALKHSRKDAQDLAKRELANFFNPEAINEDDPLGSLFEVSLYIQERLEHNLFSVETEGG